MDRQQCLYQDCAEYGVADARCSGGSWTVVSEPCAEFACSLAEGGGACAAGEICETADGYAWSSEVCYPAPETPGFVAQVGVGLICQGSESGGISGGGIRLSCHCYTGLTSPGC